MKIILKKDVRGLGRAYDVKNVADGYAANFLFPQGLAVKASDSELKKVDGLKATREADLKVQENLLIKVLGELKDKSITIEVKANEKGHLFSGIRADKLSELLMKETRLNIPVSYIKLENPIKEIGSHKVGVEVGDKKASFTVEVVGE